LAAVDVKDFARQEAGRFKMQVHVIAFYCQSRWNLAGLLAVYRTVC
jgi:hypothetical protein